MDLERLESLLEAYGANPDRWPAVDRDPALALLARSPAARARRDAAARLDRLLDAAPAAAPSPDLVARVLAAAPPAPASGGARRRPAHRWRYVAAAASLAAAAAVTLWLRSPEPAATPLTAQEIALLGVYEAPTDALLGAPSGDFVYGVPELGCERSGLGCPDLDVPQGRTSDRGSREVTA